MPQISVIVPVYKVERYLSACLDSILAQTFTDFELILVDDGSPDRCGAICDEYASRDARIRVIHQENGGLSAARNAGMDISRGEYISFVDSDDYVSPVYLEILHRVILMTGASVSVCRYRAFSDGQVPIERKNESEKEPVIFTGHEATIKLYNGNSIIPVNAWGKLYQRSLVQDMRFPVGRLHEDQAFVPIVFYRSKLVAAVEDKLYYYRDREDSITGKFSLKRYDDIWAIDQCIGFFETRGETEIVAAALEKRYRILCGYSILAKAASVSVPAEYDVRPSKALRCLRKYVSDEKYMYFMSKVYPKRVRPYAYFIKLKSVITRGKGS